MKHTFKTILVAAMAVVSMAFAGCTKEDNNNSNISTNGGSVPDGWVDLGLPSGLLWAECNVGANAPEEYGDYFAWGETEPKSDYTWSTYRYCTVDSVGNLSTLTKYKSNHTVYDGPVDNLYILEPTDDAATVHLGNGARTPTEEEWQELINNTDAEWTSINGINGKKFTGPNGNTLFLPVAGEYIGTVLRFANTYGYYWSASLHAASEIAGVFDFSSNNQFITALYRYAGQSVRAVRARQN